MIFCSKNENGVPAWKLVLEEKKTVTRRTRPLVVGKDYAVCPGRGKFAVCRIKVLSCVDDAEWCGHIDCFKEEAKREGFESWEGVTKWFIDKYGEFPDELYRIEFEKVKE